MFHLKTDVISYGKLEHNIWCSNGLKALLSQLLKHDNDDFSVSDTGILGKNKNSEFSQQESNL